MATAIKHKPLYEGLKVTREEYLELQDDGYKYDMIDGVLHLSPSPYSSHGECQAKLAYQFTKFLLQNKSGRVIIKVDIFLPDGGDVLCPDISIVLNENDHIIKGHIHGTPDIIVEILSMKTRSRDPGIKTNRYLQNGIKEYWIADPENKTLSLWINDNQKQWIKLEGDRFESRILKGFGILEKDVFNF